MSSLMTLPARTRLAGALGALVLAAIGIGPANAAGTGVGTTTDPFTGDAGTQVYTVHGVVVHRIPLENTFVLAAADGTMLAISGQTLPPFGRRAVVRVQRVGATVQEVTLVRVGTFVPDVHLHGTVSFVSPRGRRYTLSAGGASIGIRHRLKGQIPALGSVVTLGARETADGLLVERRLIEVGGTAAAVQAVGTLEGVIPPTTDPVLTSTEDLTSGCPNGCIVISGDDQGSAGDAIPIALTTSAFSPSIQSAASAVHQAAKKPGGGQPIVVAGWNKVTNKPSFAVRPTATSAPVSACGAAGGDYAIVTSGACPSGSTTKRVSTSSLTKVTNLGSACVTGLALSGTATVYATGPAACIDAPPPATPVTLK
jgi:hypothetical protein